MDIEVIAGGNNAMKNKKWSDAVGNILSEA